MKFLKKYGRRITATVLTAVMLLSLCVGYLPINTVNAAGTFPASGVHTGTLSHGSYYTLTNLYNSTNAKVCEADTMTSEGDSRACFCLSPGVSETTKKGAYKSATYQSGYGLKYHKAMIAFYYDNKDSYKTNAVRFTTQFFVWRTVVLERNHKGNFAASAYDGSGFKSGFISTLKKLMGYSDTTATNLYNKAYNYIKNGANGAYNNKVALLKWTASASQTMLTGKVYSNKDVKIKINKDIDQSGTGISLAGTKYELHEGSATGTKVGTFTLDKNGVNTITLKKDGIYASTIKYYLKETSNVAGTTSNKNNKPVTFDINWGKIKDGSSGGTVTLNQSGVSGSKPAWLVTGNDFTTLCKNQLLDLVPHISVTVNKTETGTNKKLPGAEFTIYAYNAQTGKYDTKVTAATNLGHAVTNPIVTNANGVATSAELYYTSKNLGKFIITETKAPADHTLSGASKTFSISSGNGITNAAQKLTYKFDNVLIENDYPITLEKIDEETGTPIYDSAFQISVFKNRTDGQYYKYGTVDAGTPQYDMYWAETQSIPQLKDGDGNLTNTFQKDKLKANRTYQIVETKRPAGYSTGGGVWGFGHGVTDLLKSLADADKNNMNLIIVFNLNNDGTVEILNNYADVVISQNFSEPITVHNNQASGEVTVKKQDDKTNIPLPHASFELWEVTKDQYNTAGYVPSADNGNTLAGAGETDENGELTFGKRVKDSNGEHRENGTVLAEHYYLLVETNPPEGYRLPENNITKVYIGADEATYTMSSFMNAFEKTFVIENEKAALDLNLHKISTSRTGKESVSLPGAKFNLYKVSKIVDTVGIIDDDTTGAIENGSDTDVTSVSDTGAGNETGNTIDYSELTNENYIDFDYSTITPVVADITTDSNGDAVIPEILEAGGYVLVETQAPKNYLEAEPQYIFIDNNTLVSSRSYEIEVRDQEFEALIKITKTDSETGKVIPQAGVGFKIKNLDTGEYVKQTVDYYKDPEIEGAPHELIKSEETDIFYTDETGTVLLPNVLAIGNYQAEEVEAPKGYLLNETPIKFTIDDEEDYYPDDPNKQYDIEENSRDVVINITFSDVPTTVELSKKDLTSGKELPGAHLKVWYEDNGKTVVADEWISGEKPHIIKALEFGRKYHMTETIPAKGYATASDVIFTVEETADIQKVTMYDDTIKVKIIKIDSRNKEKKLKDAEFTFKLNGKKVATVTTDENGEAYLEGVLAAGTTYVVSESKPPEGYKKKPDFKYTVKDTAEVQVITVKNERNGDATPNTPKWRGSGGKSPLTGDFRNPWTWIMIIAVSAVVLLYANKKRKEEDESEAEA